MKHKITSFLFVCLLFSSCHTPTNEEKGMQLAESVIKKQLYYPDTFEPVECEVDTAFAPNDTPEMFALLEKMSDVYEKLEDAETLMKQRERHYEMEKSFGSYSSFQVYQIKRAKEDYEEAESAYEKQYAKFQAVAEEFQQLVSQPKTIVGWKIGQSFKAKTNGGDVRTGTLMILADPDFTKAIEIYDEDQLMKISSFANKMQELIE